MPNCSRFESLDGLDDYLSLIRSETNFSEVALTVCQHEICVAIWGDGNPDISGIGVSIGYGLEVGLGFGLAAAILAFQAWNRPSTKLHFVDCVLQAAMEAFFNCAIYFALAVELASVVMLAQKDFGISTKAFGANDAQIAMANSVVCILPLLYPVALASSTRSRPPGSAAARPPESDAAAGASKPDAEVAAASNPVANKGRPGGGEERVQDGSPAETLDPRRAGVRLVLFCLLAVVFTYPFFSQCIHNWAPSRVGGPRGGTSLASDAEWGAVEHVCLGDVRLLNDVESNALAAAELVGALLIYAFALWHLAVAAVHKLESMDGKARNKSVAIGRLVRVRDAVESLWKHPGRPVLSGLATATLLLIPLLLSIPPLWGIFRLRDIQAKTVDRMGSHYTGNEWGFGQIIGVAIFAPVFTETGVEAWKRRDLLCK